MTYLTNTRRIISSNNGSTSVLTSNSSYTGTYENVSEYESITVSINSDVDSENCGVILYFSDDNMGTHKVNNTFTYFSGQPYVQDFAVTGNFFKLVYTNGSVNQSSFIISVFLNNTKKQESIKNKQIGNTVFNIKYDSGKNLLCEDEYSNGTGVANYDSTNSYVSMEVSANTDQVIRQSRQYIQPNQNDKCRIFLTGVINGDSNGNNSTSRIGYFDNQNGYFFEYSSETIKIVQRNKTTDVVINQTNWNVDKMDGSGTSGITIDFSKVITYFIELNWTENMNICGIYYLGEIYFLHIFRTESNIPLIAKSSLPTRFEISSSGDSGKLIQISTSVEFNQQIITGNIFSVINSSDLSGANFSKTESYIMSIKLDDNVRNMVKLNKVNMLSDTSGILVLYRIYLVLHDTDLPGTSYSLVNDNSLIKYSVIADPITTTNWILLDSGFFQDNIVTEFKNDKFVLSANISTGSYESNHFVITAQKLGTSATANLYTSISWTEYI